MIPISVMGDYISSLKKYEAPRSPYDEDEDRAAREMTMFGNPYRKIKRGSAKGGSEISLQDSVMNEAEEEGSHEFNKTLLPAITKRKTGTAGRDNVPKLMKMPLLEIPNFHGLSWNDLHHYEYSRKCK